MNLKDEERELLGEKESALDRETHPVYEPREDSELLLRHVREHAKGRVLDMGTGAGILAQEAAKYADEVCATDINPKAVEALKDDPYITALESDLFSHPKLARRFDLIVFNPPYLPKEEGIDDIAVFGGKKGYETTVSFIEQVSDYLTDEGCVLLLFSTLTGKEKVDQAIHRALLTATCLEVKPLFYERLFVYKIQKQEVLTRIQGSGVHSIRYMTAGKRGLVFTAEKDKKKVVVKVTHPETDAKNRVDIEARWLAELAGKIHCPKRIDSGDSWLVCEYIEGERIEEYVRTHTKEAIKNALISVLEQCRHLDRLGVDKEEMHRPLKHIIIGEDVYLIDFERAHHTQRPRNVTQFCQFLATRRFSSQLTKKGIGIEKEAILRLARAYKKTYSEEEYNTIVEYIRAT